MMFFMILLWMDGKRRILIADFLTKGLGVSKGKWESKRTNFLLRSAKPPPVTVVYILR
jgi:hypothetical protein